MDKLPISIVDDIFVLATQRHPTYTLGTYLASKQRTDPRALSLIARRYVESGRRAMLQHVQLGRRAELLADLVEEEESYGPMIRRLDIDVIWADPIATMRIISKSPRLEEIEVQATEVDERWRPMIELLIEALAGRQLRRIIWPTLPYADAEATASAHWRFWYSVRCEIICLTAFDAEICDWACDLPDSAWLEFEGDVDLDYAVPDGLRKPQLAQITRIAQQGDVAHFNRSCERLRIYELVQASFTQQTADQLSPALEEIYLADPGWHNFAQTFKTLALVLRQAGEGFPYPSLRRITIVLTEDHSLHSLSFVRQDLKMMRSGCERRGIELMFLILKNDARGLQRWHVPDM